MHFWTPTAIMCVLFLLSCHSLHKTPPICREMLSHPLGTMLTPSKHCLTVL